MAYATADDVTVLLQRPLSTDEQAAVAARLAWLTARINLRFPTLAARVAGDPDLAVFVGGVVASAALRVLSGGSASASDRVTSETVGGITLRYGEWSSSSTSTPALDLTDEEWDLLGGLVPEAGVGRAAFTIRPYGAPDLPNLPYRTFT